MNQAGKSVLITGAASGIGAATARRFAAGGWLVGVADIDDAALADAVGALRDFEDRLSGVRRSLHGSIDRLNNELAARIAGGGSTAESP